MIFFLLIVIAIVCWSFFSFYTPYLKQKEFKRNPFAEANPNALPFAIIIDTETTGLRKYDGMPTKKVVKDFPGLFPDIVEIAWITVSREYEEVTRKSFILKQEGKIPQEAIDIHGITDERCEKEGVDFLEVYEKLQKDIGGCDYLVGHNVMFDKRVIEGFCIKRSFRKPFYKMKTYDTMKMGKQIMRRTKFKLEDLAFEVFSRERIEEKISFHNASHDVWITTNLFCWLHKNGYKF